MSKILSIIIPTYNEMCIRDRIELDLDGDVVHNVKFTGGCNGNLKAIPKLVEGLTVAQVEEKSVSRAQFRVGC